MSSLKIKKKNLNAIERNGKLYRTGYEAGRADVLKSMDEATSRLTADATLFIAHRAEAEYMAGEQRMAFLLRLCLETIGHPPTVEKLKADADAATESQKVIDL